MLCLATKAWVRSQRYYEWLRRLCQFGTSVQCYGGSWNGTRGAGPPVQCLGQTIELVPQARRRRQVRGTTRCCRNLT